jgi:hypothetical protein
MSRHEHEPDHESPPVTPVWVKACGVIALILVVLFVVLHLTGHAPMGHGG